MADLSTRAARSARMATKRKHRGSDCAHALCRSWPRYGADKAAGRLENLRNVVQTVRNETALECCG